MSLYRYKGSKIWTMDFVFNAQRIRESTQTASKTLAKKIMDKRRRGLEEGTASIKKRKKPQLFSVAAKEYLEAKKAKLAASSLTIE